MLLKSEFLKIINERGFVYQATDLEALDAQMTTGPITAYIGFDATASSFHVGSLVQIMVLYWLQQTGNRPLVLMGGGTTKIGDPTGKDESRKLLTDEEIRKNIQCLAGVFKRALTFGNGPSDAILLNNADWIDTLNYPAFLRDYGTHFTINRMLSFESVRQRLEREHPMTFLEFNYMILQAYDFLEFYKTYNCILEIGGSDQWGNIINGVELVRKVTHKTVYGLTTPLITTSSGAKMGKTAQGAVWLNSDRLPSYDYWQFWRNTEDQDVGRFLRLFTTLPLEEIKQLEKLEGAEINEAKKILADQATAFIHGDEAVQEARATAQKLFETPGASLDEAALPTIILSGDELKNGASIMDLFCRLGLTSSKGEARRLIEGGGARLDDEPIKDELLTLTAASFESQPIFKLSAGKKRHGLVKRK
ncbi:MAG TPA: tyrosine--tRNA ligase [Alphaproteobacteria bacterium]|nr:tyrosine--tRNA ligase [Alphaproteobacteria bacterium]